MWNVNSERESFVPRIYSSLSEGRTNEDRGYALLLLAIEVVSFILDLFGGSQWGYLLASFLLSVLVLATTVYVYFIKRSTIKSEAQQQLIALEIVFSILQLIISCYCLIKTLSGVDTNYSSSVFPLAYAAISVFFTFKSRTDVSHSSSNTPSNQVGIVEGTSESELERIIVNPRDPTSVSVPAPVANFDPPNPTLVSVTASDANVAPPDRTSVSEPASDANVYPSDPLDPELVPASDANVYPSDPELVPASDANVYPSDPELVPASDDDRVPSDPKPVSVPASDANFPQARTVRRRNRQTQLSSVNERTGPKELVFEVDQPNDKAKKKLSRIPGVYSVEVDMKKKKLTLKVTEEVDLGQVRDKLRKLCKNTEPISVRPAKQPKKRKRKQRVEKKDSEGQVWPYYDGEENPNACVIS